MICLDSGSTTRITVPIQEPLGLPELDAGDDALDCELTAILGHLAHGLKSPLWAVDGLSHALLEDAGARLFDHETQYIHRMLGTYQSMTTIIEAISRLAGVGRHKMVREALDLSDLAAAVGRELLTEAWDTGAVHVQDGLRAHGDATLIRQVLEELLKNAATFTASRHEPRIEVGESELCHAPTRQGWQNQNLRVFFVRDNGIGYDHQNQSERLFCPFQRLHAGKEFAGLGLGLTLVRRIVHRHGGRTWAYGRPDQGAVFFFSLPGIPADTSGTLRTAHVQKHT